MCQVFIISFIENFLFHYEVQMNQERKYDIMLRDCTMRLHNDLSRSMCVQIGVICNEVEHDLEIKPLYMYITIVYIISEVLPLLVFLFRRK